MKKKFYLLFFLVPLMICLDIQATTAQELDWVRTASSIYKQGAMIARDANNNVVSCGYIINDRIFTRKWDKFGNFLWERQDTSGVHNNFEESSWITTDASNNIITLGYRYTISSNSQFPNAIVILKYAPDGKLLFRKTIDGVVGPGPALRCELDLSGNIFIGAAGLITGQAQAGFNLAKLDANGNIVFITVHNFGNVHGVNSMRYRNGYIALTGTTTFNGFNCTTALFNANGNYLWGVTTTSLSGQDVEVDNAGNVYTVNTDYASGFDQDIKVTKYSTTGSVLFTYFYDNDSNYEKPARINLQPDGNLVVSGVSSTPATGIVTFKISPAGSLIWDEFLSTAAIPQVNFLASNFNNGDIFITGTTSITGSPAGITTIRYDANGNKKWNAIYDSTATKGMGAAIGGDGRVFVVGQNQWTVLHYIDTTAAGSCGIPAHPAAGTITNNGATISWNAVANAISYHVRYKTVTSSIWVQVSTDQTTLTLTGLSAGTTYDFGVEAICNNGASGFSATEQFTTSGIPYCTSMGLDASQDRINFVWLGGIMNQTLTVDGYADYSSLSTELVKGSTNTITLSANLGGAYSQTWRIWIDLNHDGDFLDDGELRVAFKSGNFGWNIKTVKVPNKVLLGPTRMRVSLKKGGPAQGPCEVSSRGEVEDYTVNIISQQSVISSFAQSSGATQKEIADLSIFPNPAKDYIILNLKGWEGVKNISIYDAAGKQIQSKQSIDANELKFNVSSLKSGIYMLRVFDEAGHVGTVKFIKQ